jgi:hypothetical protein
MSYLDYEKLETIDPAQFQQAKPYPWLNPAGVLTETGYQRLLANLADISGSSRCSASSALMASGCTTAMFLSTVISLTCSRAGATSSPNFRASVTAASCGACSAEAEPAQLSLALRAAGLFRLAPLRRQKKTRLPHLLF